MTPLREDIERAREWLSNQRAVVHPGPIETIQFALSLAEVVVAHREAAETSDAVPR
jgi:hypothetical protein